MSAEHGTCRLFEQNPGIAIYFSKELTEEILKTMPLSKTKKAPVYLVDVEPNKIVITVSKPRQ